MGYTVTKRLLDIAIAALILVLVSPPGLILAALLWLCQGRPIFYRQLRVGRDGQPFPLFKFRTMRAGVPAHLPDRPVAKAPNDPRVTPLGRLLRRLALDELPQLLNVLRGEMSLVGPRPLPVEDLERPGWLAGCDAAERARRLAWLRRRHAVLPGLTGLWQVSGKPEADFDNWIVCDTAYVERRSLWLDVRILAQTPWAILCGRRRPPR